MTALEDRRYLTLRQNWAPSAAPAEWLALVGSATSFIQRASDLPRQGPDIGMGELLELRRATAKRIAAPAFGDKDCNEFNTDFLRRDSSVRVDEAALAYTLARMKVLERIPGNPVGIACRTLDGARR